MKIIKIKRCLDCPYLIYNAIGNSYQCHHSGIVVLASGLSKGCLRRLFNHCKLEEATSEDGDDSRKR